VRDVVEPVGVGDRVRVKGEIVATRTVRASEAFAVPRWGLWYASSVSFLAGLWVLWRLVHQWRVDFGTLVLVPRAVDRHPEERRSD